MKALILVDYENEWIDPESSYFVGDISDVISRTNRLIGWARKNNHKIIFTVHEEPESTTEFAPNSKNTQFIHPIAIEEGDIVIRKHKISPFYETDLEHHLQGIADIVVAGILTNLCVRSLVSDAYDRDFHITVVMDCCVSMVNKTQEFTINDLKATRPEIEFLNADEVVG